MKLLRSVLIPHHTNTYKPHLIRRHGLAVVLVLVLSIQQIAALQLSSQGGSVLGYATNVSISGLLAGTNSNRSAQGLDDLTLSSTLNSAAQSKAQHMIANNYWAHDAPDGTTPWFFFDSAGYSYLAAGENLAYGFDTSSGVIGGWMASPGHKANILNTDYEEVGFGIANGASFQGGPNTVVVAHYGDPVQSSSQPTAQPEVANATPEPPAAAPIDAADEEPAASPAEEPAEETTQAQEESTGEEPAAPLQVITSAPDEKRISNFEAILNGQAHWSLFATVSLLLTVALIYAYRHVLFLHNAIVKGEKFIASHPLLEASLIYIALWLLLTGTHGVIF